MGEKMIGNWEQEYVENFEQFMAELGVNFLLRKLGRLAITKLTFKNEGDDWSLSYIIAHKSGELKFKLGQEIDEVSPDGRKVKSTFTIEDGTFKQIQVGKPYDVSVTRKVEDDGKMYEVATIVGKEIVCKRTYARK